MEKATQLIMDTINFSKHPKAYNCIIKTTAIDVEECSVSNQTINYIIDSADDVEQLLCILEQLSCRSTILIELN